MGSDSIDFQTIRGRPRSLLKNCLSLFGREQTPDLNYFKGFLCDLCASAVKASKVCFWPKRDDYFLFKNEVSQFQAVSMMVTT